MLNKYCEINIVSFMGIMWVFINLRSNLDFWWVLGPSAVLFLGGYFIHAYKGRSSEYKDYKDEGK